MNLLEVQGLSKIFGGLVAVNNVSFNVEAGAVVGLNGPNGAGKTTIFNLITGIYRPDQGEITFNQVSVVGRPTHRIIAMGIGRTFQTIRLFQNLSVIENVLAGCHCQMKAGVLSSMIHTPGQRAEEKRALDAALRFLEFVGLRHEVQQLAKNLSYGNQRLLEVARALATRPKLL